MSEIKLSREQQYLFSVLEKSNRNVFITGRAGTGKTVLLSYFKQNTVKNVLVAAPTGVAALNVGGQTIHSLFQIKPGFVNREELGVYGKTAELLQLAHTIVIDEISMVRADLMDAMDVILKKARRNSLPFGGIQMAMFGDLYQLPPVVDDPELHKYFTENHGGFYFFNADVWNHTGMELYELNNIFRQKDEEFKELLNAIRENRVGEEQLKILNSRTDAQNPPDEVITLAATNRTADMINQARLRELATPIYEYKAAVEGEMNPNHFPTEQILRLKEGAQVMFLKNDKDKRWVNGTVGRVVKLSKDSVEVAVNGIAHPVSQETWEKIRYTYNPDTRKIEEEPVSAFTQYPLKLAWALTIHKAQGKTYNHVIVDIGRGAFAHGQTYVALSRCRSLGGLYLKRQIRHEDIMVDPLIAEFMSRAKVMETEENV